MSRHKVFARHKVLAPTVPASLTEWWILRTSVWIRIVLCIAKAVNREDKRCRRYRDRDFGISGKSRRYRDR